MGGKIEKLEDDEEKSIWSAGCWDTDQLGKIQQQSCLCGQHGEEDEDGIQQVCWVGHAAEFEQTLGTEDPRNDTWNKKVVGFPIFGGGDWNSLTTVSCGTGDDNPRNPHGPGGFPKATVPHWCDSWQVVHHPTENKEE